jgi:hypothetical protein
MSRRPSTFRQRDLCAAIKAARAAGVEVFRIEIDPTSGRMVVVVMSKEQGTNNDDGVRWTPNVGQPEPLLKV